VLDGVFAGVLDGVCVGAFVGVFVGVFGGVFPGEFVGVPVGVFAGMFAGTAMVDGVLSPQDASTQASARAAPIRRQCPRTVPVIVVSHAKLSRRRRACQSRPGCGDRRGAAFPVERTGRDC
jgi:hypothetical protein